MALISVISVTHLENGFSAWKSRFDNIVTEIRNGYDKISSSLNNGDPSNRIGKEDEYYNLKETATPPSTELPNVTAIAMEKNGSNDEGNAAISQIVSKDPALDNLSNAAGPLIGHIMNTHLSGAGGFGKYNVRF